MAIKYIQFLSDVSIGGDLGSITSWSRDKHAKVLEPEERGSWVFLHLLRPEVAHDAKHEGVTLTSYVRTGERRRIPLTNVAYITEDGEDRAQAKPSKAGAQ